MLCSRVTSRTERYLEGPILPSPPKGGPPCSCTDFGSRACWLAANTAGRVRGPIACHGNLNAKRISASTPKQASVSCQSAATQCSMLLVRHRLAAPLAHPSQDVAPGRPAVPYLRLGRGGVAWHDVSQLLTAVLGLQVSLANNKE